MTEVALLFPVLGRPQRVKSLLGNLARTTPEPHRTIFAASDEETIRELLSFGAEYITDEGESWPTRINRLYSLTTEPYVFLGADDYTFYLGWLTEALRVMADVDGVVALNDMHNPDGTACLVSRRYVEQEGATWDEKGIVIHPGYQHNWSDTELFNVARSKGRYAYCKEAIVEHMHPSAGKAHEDATYRLGQESELQDRVLFNRRQNVLGSK